MTLLSACKAALEHIASNTPLVNSDVPISGDIADQCDRVRAILRDAIEQAERQMTTSGAEVMTFDANSHTPAPWDAAVTSISGRPLPVRAITRKFPGNVIPSGFDMRTFVICEGGGLSAADAMHIVRCVNACEQHPQMLELQAGRDDEP